MPGFTGERGRFQTPGCKEKCRPGNGWRNDVGPTALRGHILGHDGGRSDQKMAIYTDLLGRGAQEAVPAMAPLIPCWDSIIISLSCMHVHKRLLNTHT